MNRKGKIFMLTYSYKTINSDFIVTEIINLILDGGNYHYYLMRKKGYKTIDVIDKISAEMNVDICDISYAGLKDEDAVTSQYIAIKGDKTDNLVRKDGDREFSLSYAGSADSPMQIGKLQGNSFRIRIRNIDLYTAQMIWENKKHAFSVINYFDIQRFGMPGLPKLSHKIGKCLLEKNYEMALMYLYDSGNMNLIDYSRWKNSSEEYINQMEIRRKSFFLSAYDSFIWNRNIADIVGKTTSKNCLYTKGGIEFKYASEIDDKIRNELKKCNIIWHRYDENGDIFEKKSFRQPYLEVLYDASGILPDDIYLGKNMIDIEFIVPAGVYATNVVDQIMNALETNKYYSYSKSQNKC